MYTIPGGEICHTPTKRMVSPTGSDTMKEIRSAFVERTERVTTAVPSLELSSTDGTESGISSTEISPQRQLAGTPANSKWNLSLPTDTNVSVVVNPNPTFSPLSTGEATDGNTE